MKGMWWKLLGIVLVLYAIIGGFLMPVPSMPILNETIRNTYFHIPMWFAMMILMTASLVNSIQYLSSGNLKKDTLASETINVALLLGFLGLFTGMIWANYTWGTPWTNDVKLNGTAVAILIYVAYIILRGSLQDEHRRAKVAAVYNIFSFVMMMLFINVIPRLSGTDSLHPGNGGNPAFGEYDMNSTMRMVFYPAVIGWTLIGTWIVSLRMRINKIENKLFYD
ncbi:MAG: ABC transporter permease [Crocinitomicaceae bacterium]|nr:ABC transporter permease [Crocinitomicaceae bacterium]|tara:strand:- start:2973 stop:3641 length:669 start_codon:yes stop_codon:yes gene_type:complete